MSGDDPKRLLETADTTPEERDLLRSAGGSEPPPEARAAVWGALATRLPGIGGGGPTGGGGGSVPGPAAGGAGAGTATGASTALKVAGSIALVGLIAGGIGIAMTKDRTPPNELAASSAPAAPSAPPLLPSANEALPPASAEAPSMAPSIDEPSTPIAGTSVAATSLPPRAKGAPTSAPPPPPTSRAAALQHEAALLASAREALRGGNARRALSILDDARVKHPAGGLVQEREVVAIEALAQAGDKAAAARRAEAFLRSFPGSPHSSHVRTFLVR